MEQVPHRDSELEVVYQTPSLSPLKNTFYDSSVWLPFLKIQLWNKVIFFHSAGTCQRRKSTSVTYSIYDGSVPFRCSGEACR